MLEHPQITRTLRTGYPHRYKPWVPERLVKNPCGCGYESVVEFYDQPLCEKCAADEGIEVI